MFVFCFYSLQIDNFSFFFFFIQIYNFFVTGIFPNETPTNIARLANAPPEGVAANARFVANHSGGTLSIRASKTIRQLFVSLFFFYFFFIFLLISEEIKRAYGQTFSKTIHKATPSQRARFSVGSRIAHGNGSTRTDPYLRRMAREFSKFREDPTRSKPKRRMTIVEHRQYIRKRKNSLAKYRRQLYKIIKYC